MSYAVVTLKKGEGRTLKAGGAWIFDNEIESITGGFDNGSIVLVHDFDGYPMGRGFINQNSKIRVRMMTRDIHQEIDEAFLRMRVKNAWEYRKTTVDTSSCRLIFGEADFLPGLTVDKYEDVLVVECLALGMEAFKETIVNLLKEVLAEDGVIIRGVFERSDANERKKEGLPKVKGWIGEPYKTEVEIVENGVHYLVDVENGQKTGFFLDPPAFTKSRQATKNAIKGYREINIKGLKLVKDGGYLATCSCSHFMTQELLAKTVREAARSAHKRLRQVEFRTQSPDHPILWAADESYYLKFFIFQVVDEK